MGNLRGCARWVAVTAGVLALAACTGTATDDDDGEEAGASPFWSYVEGQLGESQDDLRRIAFDEEQAAIASCMSEAGFDYWPESSSSTTIVTFSTGEEWEEKLRTSGWGQFTQALDDGAPVLESPDTPNSQYVSSLSAEAQAQYERALYGEWDPATGQLVEGSEGCFFGVLEGDELDTPDKRYEDLLEEIRSAWEVAEAGPEVQAALDEYRRCMTQAGHPGIRTDPNELLEAKYAETFPGMEMASNDPRLPELAAWEISLANAHLDCLDETKLDEVRRRASDAVEREIMERRSAEVEAYLDELRERAQG